MPRLLLALNNLMFALAFFAAFGAFNEFDCDDNWHGWKTTIGKDYLACWKAAEAFCFISGFSWLVSAFLAYPTYSNKLVKHPEKRVSTGSEGTEQINR